MYNTVNNKKNCLYRGSIRVQGGTGGDSEVPNDKTLSDILDEVIENMPYNDRSAPDVNVILDLESNRQLRTDYAVRIIFIILYY